VLVLRPRLSLMVRRGGKPLLVFAILFVAMIGLTIVSVAVSYEPRLAHQLGALGLLVIIYGVASSILFSQLARRTGFYAKPGEVGLVALNGSPRPPSDPVTHFVRIIAVNKFGIGKLRAVPVTYGLNRSGQRVVGLSELVNEPQEIDAFIGMSGLPLEGETPERLGMVGLVMRFPLAPEARAQLRIGFPLAAPFALLLVVGLLLIAFAVH
jgi:hypothetical protein